VQVATHPDRAPGHDRLNIADATDEFKIHPPRIKSPFRRKFQHVVNTATSFWKKQRKERPESSSGHHSRYHLLVGEDPSNPARPKDSIFVRNAAKDTSYYWTSSTSYLAIYDHRLSRANSGPLFA
jgi:hypothetical protein